MAVHKHFQIDLLVYHLEASVVQLFLSEARGEKTLSEPLLSLLSFCHASLSLPLSPLFPGHTFTFSRLCSSRVVLSGPVLPETPGTSPLSVFSLFPLRLLSLSLSPSLHPNPYQEREREAILNPAQYFFGFLSTGASRSKSIYTFQEVIHWKDTYLVFAKRKNCR